MSYAAWKAEVTSGPPIDIDHSGDFDCVDVPKSWVMYLYPNVPWSLTIGYGNAKDLYIAANTKYFEHIPYVKGMLFQQGDILVCGPTPAPGYDNQYVNPYGHTGVLDSFTSTTYTLIQQDSGTGEKPHAATQAWSYRPIIGALRPLIPLTPLIPLIQEEVQMSASQDKPDETLVRLVYQLGVKAAPTADDVAFGMKFTTVEALLRHVITSPEHANFINTVTKDKVLTYLQANLS